MNRLALALVAALSVSACAPVLEQVAGPAPAPLAGTTIDDAALETAWRSFDAALDALNVLADLGVIKPGSPTGKAIADGVRKVNGSLQAAESFAAVGSTTSYKNALRNAQAGINEIRVALRNR